MVLVVYLAWSSSVAHNPTFAHPLLPGQLLQPALIRRLVEGALWRSHTIVQSLVSGF